MVGQSDRSELDGKSGPKRKLWIAGFMATGFCLACSVRVPFETVMTRQDALQALKPLASTLRPGRWRITNTTLKMNTPGIPAWLRKSLLARPDVSERCVSAKDVLSFMGDSVLVGEDPRVPMKCSVERLHIAENTIQSDTNCRMDPIRLHSYHVQVEVGPERIVSSSTGTIRDSRSMLAMTEGEAVAEWIGECAADE